MTEVSGRKVWLKASLSDPTAEAGKRIHCEAKGLFLIKKEEHR